MDTVELNRAFGESFERASRGRSRAHGIFVGSILVGVILVASFFAAPGFANPVFWGPAIPTALVALVAAAGYLGGLAWMWRIIRADPERGPSRFRRSRHD